MTPAKKRLVVTLTTAGRGGIRAVVDAHERDGLFSRWNVRAVYTHVEGSLARRLFVAFSAMLQLLRLLLTGQVLFVHCHVAMRGSFWRKTICANIAALFRVPVLFHLHGSEMKTFYFAQRPYVRRLISRQLERVNRVIVLSDSWRDFINEIAPRARVTIIPNYVSTPVLSTPRPGHDGTRVIFLGLLGNRKGIYDLLAAFSRIAPSVPKMQLLIGGNGEVDKVTEAVGTYGIGAQVKVLGWVSGDTKAALLQTGDIFVLPSYNEGLPVSILEAMSWAIPVISTFVGGIPQLVRDGTDGVLINAGDVSALAQALLRLGQDCALRQRMGHAARTRVESSFSREVVLPRLESIYRELNTNRFQIAGQPSNSQ
jgi:glycosyltransferase involved in cell wall biosynthesis